MEPRVGGLPTRVHRPACETGLIGLVMAAFSDGSAGLMATMGGAGISDALSLGRFAAVRKPSGRIRGIVAGAIWRRHVGRARTEVRYLDEDV